jgi:hypothetical protein
VGVSLSTKGFLLELMKCNRISLGSAELRCLNLIASEPISAYGVYSLEKKKIDIKNIRKTFKKIRSKGLIEETGVELPHKAIEYKLTSQGLFQCLLKYHVMPSDLKFPLIPIDLKQYENNIILKKILYEFFDASTLEHFFTLFRTIRLIRYLRNCCEVILERIEQYKATRFYKYYKQPGHQLFGHIPVGLSNDIDRLIMNEIEGFVLQIAINSQERIPDFILRRKGEPVNIPNLRGVPIRVGTFVMIHKDAEDYIDDPNYQYAYPNLALAKDKKFTKLLNEIKTKFNDGSHDLLLFFKTRSKA